MQKRFLLIVAIAIAAAMAASSAVYRVTLARTAAPKQHTGQTALVAARDLSLGALVESSDVRQIEWEGPAMSSWATNKDDIVGRGVIAPINKGEPFANNRLAPKGAGAGLAVVIPAGMRAVAVKVDDVVAVSGFVLPGMRVDVISSGIPPGQTTEGTVTRTILQNIQVLSAGQNFERDVQGKPATANVVNLLVTPEQAECLSLAGAQTKIQLVLRNPLDDATVATPGTSTSRLLHSEAAPKIVVRTIRSEVPKAQEPKAEIPIPPTVVEVFNGAKKQTTVVRPGGAEEQKN